MSDASTLIQNIRRAFVDVPRPDIADIPLCNCAECEWIGEEFGDIDPFNASDDWLYGIDQYFHELSPNAKKFYLPLWLVESAKNPGCTVSEVLVAASNDGSKWAPVIAYSPEQRSVVEQVLRLIAEIDDSYLQSNATKAIEFWRTSLQVSVGKAS